jgi:hypothetical protein
MMKDVSLIKWLILCAPSLSVYNFSIIGGAHLLLHLFIIACFCLLNPEIIATEEKILRDEGISIQIEC